MEEFYNAVSELYFYYDKSEADFLPNWGEYDKEKLLVNAGWFLETLGDITTKPLPTALELVEDFQSRLFKSRL